MQHHYDQRLQELKEIHKKVEELLKQQLPQKIYRLKTVQVGFLHLELDIAWLQEQQGEIYATNHH